MKKETAIKLLTALMVVTLLCVTWTQIAISTWIVGHSGVEDLMIKDGKTFETFVKDFFFHLGPGMLLLEVFFGSVLLWLVQRLTQKKAKE